MNTWITISIVVALLAFWVYRLGCKYYAANEQFEELQKNGEEGIFATIILTAETDGNSIFYYNEPSYYQVFEADFLLHARKFDTKESALEYAKKAVKIADGLFSKGMNIGLSYHIVDRFSFSPRNVMLGKWMKIEKELNKKVY